MANNGNGNGNGGNGNGNGNGFQEREFIGDSGASVAVAIRPRTALVSPTRLPPPIFVPPKPPPPTVLPQTFTGPAIQPPQVPPSTMVDPMIFDDPVGAESFVHKRIIGAVTGFATGGFGGAVGGFLTGGGGGPTSTAQQTVGLGGSGRAGSLGIIPGTCPDGRARTSRGCPRPGIIGAIQRFAPGGATGFADGFGEAVIGGFGRPALVPRVVGTIERRDGSVGQILRCPPGAVLAIDNLCYTKGTKGLAANRKWPPGTRPFLTGGEVKCLRRADTLRNSKANRKLLKGLGMGG